jgi:hypothetical protein
MRKREEQVSFVQITGMPADIDDLPEHRFLAGARRCVLHGHRWIEMTSITDEQVALAEENHCRIHHVKASHYSHSASRRFSTTAIPKRCIEDRGAIGTVATKGRRIWLKT